jgi:hypothetical protein
MKHLVNILLLTLFISCGTLNYYNYSIEHVKDEFDGFSIDRMNGNYIDDEMTYSYSLWLNAQKYVSKEGKPTYSLIVEYWGTEWLFINEGETLILLLDGERIGLGGHGSSNFRDVEAGQYGVASKEKAWYDLSGETLKKIAASKSVKMKIIGQSNSITRELSEKNIGNFKKFVLAYCK